VIGVSASGVCVAVCCRPPSAHAIADTALLKQIRTVQRELNGTMVIRGVQAGAKAGGEKHGAKQKPSHSDWDARGRTVRRQPPASGGDDHPAGQGSQTRPVCRSELRRRPANSSGWRTSPSYAASGFLYLAVVRMPGAQGRRLGRLPSLPHREWCWMRGTGVGQRPDGRRHPLHKRTKAGQSIRRWHRQTLQGSRVCGRRWIRFGAPSNAMAMRFFAALRMALLERSPACVAGRGKIVCFPLSGKAGTNRCDWHSAADTASPLATNRRGGQPTDALNSNQLARPPRKRGGNFNPSTGVVGVGAVVRSQIGRYYAVRDSRRRTTVLWKAKEAA